MRSASVYVTAGAPLTVSCERSPAVTRPTAASSLGAVDEGTGAGALQAASRAAPAATRENR
ncbi:MAG: hypothetical protein IPN16_25900 [Gemmatimonadetes bacterium]|nr:hypothetical protein [Gemmatimonadota bacterium]